MDYGAKALGAENRLFNDEKISEENKKILRRFLTSYDVSDARKVIFFQKIRPLLRHFSDLDTALRDRDEINKLFALLRKHYKPATYSTYIIVIQRFLTWLNNGTKAPSTCDLRVRRGRAMQRELKPEDMLLWNDGQLIASASCGVQMSAIVLTQLDCGFRPSEFVDLNYGDVQVQTGLAIIHVRSGKTGSRSVVAHRCLPALLKWLDLHPTKRPEDPLWISEDSVSHDNHSTITVRRYAYPAMRKRLIETGRRAGVRKPLDFYNLRHSSCVLDKLDNLPADLAAERHGHSVKHFVSTYGRLSVQDVVRRFQSHYGHKVEIHSSQISHRECPSCQRVNEGSADWCARCGTPFTAAGATQIANQHIYGNGQMQSELDALRCEVLNAQKREAMFRDEQMHMLRQLNDIRSVLHKERRALQVRTQ